MKKLLIFFLLFNFILANDKIITLSPAINEIVYALGLADKIVANTDFCDYPIESKKIQKVGGYGSVSLEKVVKLNPTTIINQDYDKKLNQDLKNLGFNTLVYKTNTINDIKFTINNLGEVFKKNLEAKALSDGIDLSLKSLENIVKDKKVLIVISPQNSLSNQIFVAGNFVYFEDIINASGNTNAYQSSLKSQPSINSERIISINPDIIVLLAPYTKEEKDKQSIIKMWEDLPINASKNRNIYIVDKEYAGIPSHRVKFFIDDFRKILGNVRDKKL